MPGPPTRNVTEILEDLDRDRRDETRDELWSLVYDELRRVAARFVRREKSSPTLQPTALVHETYLRLFGAAAKPSWKDRAHFFGAATRAMRQLLVERARRRASKGWAVTLDPERDVGRPMRSCDPILLAESLDRLEAEDDRSAQVVMLRFFAGLSHEDTARFLDVSVPTVKRDWAFGKAWLLDELAEGTE